MKLLLFIFPFFFIGCQTESNPIKIEKKGSEIESIDTLNIQLNKPIVDSVQESEPIIVMVIPCSNGYEYGQLSGDLNPFLEKHLAKDKRINLEEFPFKKMKGSGFHGVYDKRYCKQILETVSVDFLIMTEMSGGIVFPFVDTIQPKWGYATKILNTKTMDQFKGISGKEINSFDDINNDIQSKTNELIKLILESAEKPDNAEK